MHTNNDSSAQMRTELNVLRRRVTALESAQKLAEDALRDSEFRYRTLVEQASDGIFLADASGRYIEVNPSGCAMLGYTREEILQLHIRDLVPPEDLKAEPLRVDELHQGRSLIAERRLRRKDGGLLPVEIRAKMLSDGRMQGIVRDIADRKRAEKALQHSEEKYRRLHESMRDAFVLVDMSGAVLEFNRAYEEMLGYTPEELSRLTHVDLTPERWHPLEMQIVNEQILSRGHSDVYEKEYVRKGGDVFPVELRTFLLRDDDGNPVGMWAIVRDITERHRALEALRESEEKFRVLSEQSFLGIAIIQDGRVQYANQAIANINGYSVEEILTWSMADLARVIFQDDLAFVVEQARKKQVGDPDVVPHYAYRVITKTGTLKWIDQYSKTILYRGKPADFVTVIDITDRKQAEAQIRQFNADLEHRVRQRTQELEMANHELKDFAYVVSHDLKAPLRGISRIAQWLVADYASSFDANGQEMIELLIGRVQRMDSLIGGILEYSRIGRLVNRKEPIDTNTLVHEALDLLAPPDSLNVRIVRELPVAMGDKTRIFQVFENLLSNAIKFMDKSDGEVTIDWADEGSHWKFLVTDTGPGIDPKHHERIFQIFQTLRPRDEQENTGIGLSLVKKIVEFHGGNVGVESEVGQGSCFFFTLAK